MSFAATFLGMFLASLMGGFLVYLLRRPRTRLSVAGLLAAMSGGTAIMAVMHWTEPYERNSCFIISGIYLLACLWFLRPPRKRKRKSLKELGYKAKAALDKLIDKVKPSPLPNPV
jgi:hypothetical protein